LVAKLDKSPRVPWSAAEATELYRIESWGAPYFFVNDTGHMAVRAVDARATELDIAAIVAELRNRNVDFPVLIRFQDILSEQVKRLNQAFAAAIDEAGYSNVYRGVYPIKVNQLHEVVDEIRDAGQPYGLGLECGSKAELIATLPQIDDDTLLICNGVKDKSMLSLMLSSQRIGQNVVPVIERFAEFEEMMALSGRSKVRLGVRIRLSTPGSGRWSESSGVHSKFGLSIAELVEMLDELERLDLRSSLVLVHCHIGSQIADIQVLKQATKEVARVYAEIQRRGFGVEYLDLGGGLGVNYDKGHYEEDAGINYSLQEYANAIVYTVNEVCQANEVDAPILVTESGRALTAHHSVLIVPVLGAQHKVHAEPPGELPADAAEPLTRLEEILGYTGPMSAANELLEAYHDANELLAEVRMLFALGYLDLKQQAIGENLYWRIISGVRDRLGSSAAADMPEFAELERLLTDLYLCDFSVFQSMLDHWAIGQPFPIVPIQRLNEKPDRMAQLVDLTCDSDGKVSHYVSGLDDNRYLPLHTMVPGQNYYLGFFLMGAYEDIVGDAHNLFGRVAEAHVYADPDESGNFWIEKIIPATAIQDILAQVQYFPNDLHRRMSEIVRSKIRAGTIRPRHGMRILDQYMACFSSNTYCDVPSETQERDERSRD
jgi:arginine decarboxylase